MQYKGQETKGAMKRKISVVIGILIVAVVIISVVYLGYNKK